MLTGISYQSGLDYYKGINEQFIAAHGGARPTPNMVLVSLDIEPYVRLLEAGDFAATSNYLLRGIDRLMSAGAEVLCIASNTGHLCVPAVYDKYPHTPVIHIADCIAAGIKAKGLTRVGLLGTTPTMTQGYLKDRLAEHGIECVVPEARADMDAIYDKIVQELSVGQFKDSTRTFFLGQVSSRAAGNRMKNNESRGQLVGVMWWSRWSRWS